MDFADYWGFPATSIVGANSASGETGAIRPYGNPDGKGTYLRVCPVFWIKIT